MIMTESKTYTKKDWLDYLNKSESENKINEQQLTTALIVTDYFMPNEQKEIPQSGIAPHIDLERAIIVVPFAEIYCDRLEIYWTTKIFNLSFTIFKNGSFDWYFRNKTTGRYRGGEDQDINSPALLAHIAYLVESS